MPPASPPDLTIRLYNFGPAAIAACSAVENVTMLLAERVNNEAYLTGRSISEE